MKSTHLLALACFVLWGFSGCREEASTTLNLVFEVEWQGAPYAVGEAGIDDQGRDVQLERLECYVSDFAVHDVREGWIDIDTVARIDFGGTTRMAGLEIVGCQGLEIDGFRMGLGVPADRNTDVDPASYSDPDHPLGYKGSAGMHWGWAAGYIFSVYEGRLLTDPATPFAYHAGADTCFRSVEFTLDEPTLVPFESGDVTWTLTLDAYACLHGVNDIIDPEIDPETHTGNNLPLAIRWVDLYREAWTLTP
ncbi:MAG: hypothetical protein O3B70_06995 [Bacteroidetes bacterium]|nr:hypothetical protein [Bacteroidota bacterium]MDA0904067.1 hypothetical protein [Bacteroidota bacterium]MDA1242691.1 hypothetical protein [Bacteroidota bacterium]